MLNLLRIVPQLVPLQVAEGLEEGGRIARVELQWVLWVCVGAHVQLAQRHAALMCRFGSLFQAGTPKRPVGIDDGVAQLWRMRERQTDERHEYPQHDAADQGSVVLAIRGPCEDKRVLGSCRQQRQSLRVVVERRSIQ
eukprot:4170164-Prymnesium_polylepis.2